MRRPIKNTFAVGGGLQIHAVHKRFHAVFTVEYFQTHATWTDIGAEYKRTSTTYGTVDEKAVFHSKGKTINLGISLGFNF
jgi:hypothetical protein